MRNPLRFLCCLLFKNLFLSLPHSSRKRGRKELAPSGLSFTYRLQSAGDHGSSQGGKLSHPRPVSVGSDELPHSPKGASRDLSFGEIAPQLTAVARSPPAASAGFQPQRSMLTSLISFLPANDRRASASRPMPRFGINS